MMKVPREHRLQLDLAPAITNQTTRRGYVVFTFAEGGRAVIARIARVYGPTTAMIPRRFLPVLCIARLPARGRCAQGEGTQGSSLTCIRRRRVWSASYTALGIDGKPTTSQIGDPM